MSDPSASTGPPRTMDLGYARVDVDRAARTGVFAARVARNAHPGGASRGDGG